MEPEQVDLVTAITSPDVELLSRVPSDVLRSWILEFARRSREDGSREMPSALPSDPLLVSREDLATILTRIHAAIAAVAAEAISAKEGILRAAGDGALEASARAAIDAFTSTLLAELDDVSSRKTATLETEAVSADALLERFSQLQEEVSATASLVAHPEIVSLAARVRDVVLAAHAAPRRPVESPCISFLAAPPGSASGLGALEVPAAPARAKDVALTSLPRFGRPGCAVTLCLEVRAPPQDSAASDVCDLVNVLATLTYPAEPGGADSPPPLPSRFLGATASVIPGDASLGRAVLRVRIHVPGDAVVERGARVAIHRVTLAGECVGGEGALPLTVPVWSSLGGPFALTGLLAGGAGRRVTPAVAPGGRLFVPTAKGVLAFDPSGEPDGTVVHPAASGGVFRPRACAFFEGDGGRGPPLLLLADASGHGDSVTAIDVSAGPSPHTPPRVAWTLRVGRIHDRTSDACFGIALLPAQGVAVALSTQCAFVVRLSDGRCLSGHKLPAIPDSIAADSASDVVFISAAGRVHAFRCADSALRSAGVVEAAGQVTPVDREAAEIRAGRRVGLPRAILSARPLAVVSTLRGPDAGARSLVVGVVFTGSLRVIALPADSAGPFRGDGLTLRREQELPAGVKVVGLAADPGGGALVVCDGGRGRAVRVMRWPLGGAEGP